MAARKKAARKKTAAAPETEAFKGYKGVTPFGRTGFTKVTEPDDDGNYTITLFFEGEERVAMEDILAELQEMDDRGDSTPSGVREQVDPETEEETGALQVTLKRMAGGVRKDGTPWAAHVTVKDAHKEDMVEEIGRGSLARVAFQVYPTDYQGDLFLRLQPKSVQVKELVPLGGTDGSELFDEIDGGFETAGASSAASPHPTEGIELADADDSVDF